MGQARNPVAARIKPAMANGMQASPARPLWSRQKHSRVFTGCTQQVRACKHPSTCAQLASIQVIAGADQHRNPEGCDPLDEGHLALPLVGGRIGDGVVGLALVGVAHDTIQLLVEVVAEGADQQPPGLPFPKRGRAGRRTLEPCRSWESLRRRRYRGLLGTIDKKYGRFICSS